MSIPTHTSHETPLLYKMQFVFSDAVMMFNSVHPQLKHIIFPDRTHKEFAEHIAKAVPKWQVQKYAEVQSLSARLSDVEKSQLSEFFNNLYIYVLGTKYLDSSAVLPSRPLFSDVEFNQTLQQYFGALKTTEYNVVIDFVETRYSGSSSHVNFVVGLKSVDLQDIGEVTWPLSLKTTFARNNHNTLTIT